MNDAQEKIRERLQALSLAQPADVEKISFYVGRDKAIELYKEALQVGSVSLYLSERLKRTARFISHEDETINVDHIVNTRMSEILAQAEPGHPFKPAGAKPTGKWRVEIWLVNGRRVEWRFGGRREVETALLPVLGEAQR